MSIIQIAHNAVTAKLVADTSREDKLLIQTILSYAVAGSEHMTAFKSGSWDGRASFFDYSKGTFPRGFVTFVQSRLTKAGHTVQIARKPLPEPLGSSNPVVDTFGEDPRYDYQPEVVRKLEQYGQIIAQVATGGGKSRIAKLATARINRRTLFLTTRGVLMYQMYDSFKDINKNTAILGDGTLEVSDITCGMVQTISSHLEQITVAQEADRLIGLQANKEERQLEKLLTELKSKKATPMQVNSAVAKLNSEQLKSRPTAKEFSERVKSNVEAQEKRRQVMLNTLATFEFVILEEAHESSGNSYFEILKNCPNAHYRLALTATPFMKDDEEANMRLMASSGHVAIKVSEEMLIERGILAKPYFKYVAMLNKPDNLFKSSSWRRAYELGIVDNAYRNKHIVAETLRASKYGLSSMVLVQHKKHGTELMALMNANGLRAEYIFGEDNQAERKKAIGKLKSGEINVLIGSTILDVGVDVPAVGMVVLAGGGKAEVALRQRIGRGLRAKKPGVPNVAFVVDFADGFNNHLRDHYLTRKNIVVETKGFAENIVNDFDYEGLGFTKV
jgi:superfamily II DNA or RNA helicase